MKVLILGGTGTIGGHLVQLLAEKDFQITVTSRKRRISVGNVTYIQGNAHDVEFLKELLREHWDSIVDLMIYTTDEFEKKIQLFLNSTDQYVFISSSRVYADSDEPIIESSPRLLDVSTDKKFLQTSDYSLAKAQQEDLLKLSGKKNWTVIRPYITYSENRIQLGMLEKEEWLFRALRGKTIVVPEEIRLKYTTLTYGLDVSRGLVAIMGKKETFGEIFHITQPESCTWEHVLNLYMEVIEKYTNNKPKTLYIDTNRFFRCRGGQYQLKYDRAFNRTFDNSKISKYVSLDHFVDVDTGLKKCLRTFLKESKFKYISWKLEALKDRCTNEKTPLKDITGIKHKLLYLYYRYGLL